MNITYHNPLIKQLRDQQVRLAPRSKKLEHVNRAEKLLGEVEPGRSYPYEYLCFRITDYRPATAAGVDGAGKETLSTICVCLSKMSRMRPMSASRMPASPFIPSKS